jgi:hypothetical protein
VVPVTRTVLLPALSVAVTVLLAQVSQLAVPPNDTAAATTAPLTAMSAGRAVVVPLAYRMVSVAVPSAGAFTVHCV